MSGRLATRAEYRVDVLSPVHVGAGAALAPAEYALTPEGFYRLDPRRSAAWLDDRDRNDPWYAWERAARDPRLRLAALAHYQLATTVSGIERGEPVLEHVKDGWRRPLLPGSAVKGALLSALVSYLAHAPPDGAPPVPALAKERHDGLLLHALLGAPVRGDERAAAPAGRPAARLGRALRVADGAAEPAALTLVHTVVCRLAKRQGAVRGACFKGRRGDTVTRAGHAFAAFYEALREGAELALRLSFDGFLLGDAHRAAALVGRHRTLNDTAREALDPANLARVCNYVADLQLAAETRFFALAGLGRMAQWTEALRARIPGDDAPDFLLRAGGGLGYHGITAHAFEDEAIDAADLKHPEHRDWAEFPITRRVLVADGQPAGLMGWLRFRLADCRYSTLEARE